MTQSPNAKTEGIALGRIALPLVAAYLAEFLMFVTTKMVVGDLGYHSLAAVGISGNLSFELIAILMGLLSIVGVLCAQAEGAGENQNAGLAVRQGFIISLLIGIPATLCVYHLDLILSWTGQDQKVIELSGPFLQGLALFVIPVMLFSVLRNFVAALSKANVVMFISIAAVGLNYVLTVWLVYGGLGIPGLGLFGAGLAITIVSWLMLLCLLAYVYFTASLRGYGVFASRWKFDPVLCREILVLGIPVAGLVFLEAGMFSAASILSGLFGAKTLAAYEVVMSWAGIPFVMAMGVAEATMVRVSFGVGRGSMVRARYSGFYGMSVGCIFLIVLMVVPLGIPQVIISLFISGGTPDADEVIALSTQLLFIAAIFQVFDGLQGIAARALRGLKDSFAPLWIAGFGYWVLGIGGGALLAFYFDLKGPGLWWGLALGLMTTSLLLALRFHRITSAKLRLKIND